MSSFVLSNSLEPVEDTEMANGFELDLVTGRTLYLREIRQFETYEGLLEGLPTAEMNKRLIERMIADCRNKPYPGSPLLIQPTEKPLEYSSGKKYPFGTPAALPSVTCIGRFGSYEPVHSGDYSGLMVIWFQDEFAFPINLAVLRQIRAIDWDRHASDLEY